MIKTPLLILIPTTLIIGGLCGLFIPALYPHYFLDKSLQPGPAFKLTITKFDLLNPVITVVVPKSTDDNKVEDSMFLGVATLKRKNLIFWEAKNSTFGQTQNVSVNEALTTAKKQDLRENNPNIEKYNIVANDPAKVNPPFVEGTNGQYTSNVDQYYLGVTYRGNHTQDINIFKEKLKLSLVYSEVKNIIGKPDAGVCPGEITKTNCEDQYKIGKNSINFVAIIYDKDWADHPDAKLIKAAIVYDDRRIEEIPLK